MIKQLLKKNKIKNILSFIVVFMLTSRVIQAASITIGTADENGSNFGPIEVLFLMLILTLGPSIMIMMTSFTRIVIVMSFLRNAMGTQQSPPNQIIVGLSLFLTLFIMAPVFNEINDKALTPYQNSEITQDEAIEQGLKPLKSFMLKQTQSKDLELFLNISNTEIQLDDDMTEEEKIDEIDLVVIVPSFITSELKRAFIMGFLLFIPFLVIDMVVASTLMSMGMVMLPPGLIAMPFKILMFILIDGWSLLFSTLSQSFRL
ncbi:MAG: flagellar type III secretion system pore protein FliP [Oscillospiraceae bacterium]